MTTSYTKLDTALLSNPIAETLLIPLYMRSLQSQVEKPIIIDPLAAELVEQIDYDFSKFDNKKASEVGTALRCRYFDEKCLAFIQQYPMGVIVNVGCGLDTRCQRLHILAPKMMSDVIFYSLDIAESMVLRERLIPKMVNEIYITTSMFETAWLDSLATQYANIPILFIIEGVMMYFSHDDNKQFMSAVADRFTHAQIYFDVTSSFSYKRRKQHDVVGQMRAEFACGVDDVMMMTAWHDRLYYIEHMYFGDLPDAERMGWLVSILMKYIPVIKKSFVMIGYKTYI